MEIIAPANVNISALLGKQSIVPRDYRLSRFCLRTMCEDGELLFHNLSGELLLLCTGESPESNREELIKKWFLVPLEYDEFSSAKQIKQILHLMLPKEESLDSFLIFTTTDCNARCPYCYEKGRKRQNMSDEVAHDVAAFIKKTHSGQEIKLRWFGGEPLFNHRVIDIITKDLRDNNFSYQSHMTTNGYLFDSELVFIAVKDWNLSSVQISLDGTEKTYNRRKGYVYREGNPYQRVLRNISLLAAAGVDVSIRLNMDLHNFDDLMLLADELALRFQGEKHVGVYPALLKDFGRTTTSSADYDQILCYEQLQQKLKHLGIGRAKYLNQKISLTRCMADRDQSVTILPDGRLGKCEHESEEKLIGSIYSNTFDAERIKAWKETVSISECETCLQYPTCIKLKDCAWNADGCTERDRALMKSILTDKVLNTYHRAKGNNATDISPEMDLSEMLDH